MVFKNELYPIHFYGRVRGKCDGRLQNWPGIANERPKFLAMQFSPCVAIVTVIEAFTRDHIIMYITMAGHSLTLHTCC